MGFLYSQLFITPSLPAVSCAGQTVIVTGSNTGLGKEAARHFVRLGASKVIIAVRNLKAGQAAKEDIEATTRCSSDILEVWFLDLASYSSCKSFAEKASKLARLDVLLENAGIAPSRFEKAEGHERTITVNVISTFYLALLLIPKLKSTAVEFGVTPRLSIVTSEVHGWSKFPEWKEPNTFVALDDESKASAMMKERYPTSKLLEVLLCRQLASKLEGSNLTLNFLNPGLCHSELSRDGPFVVHILKFFLARTTEVGSRTLVAAAMAGPQSHGKYMSDAEIHDEHLSPFVRSADGKQASEKVWAELCDILNTIQVGVTANI